MHFKLLYLVPISFLLTTVISLADDLNLAVAANFSTTIKRLGEQFEAQNVSTKINISLGSSGMLFAQIRSEAPFDLFLSADAKYPAQLHSLGITTGEPKTYATGRLAIQCNNIPIQENLKFLYNDSVSRIAIADPALAPYGSASKEFLSDFYDWSKIEDKLVFGTNIGQTYQFYKSKSVDCAFLALSQLEHADNNYYLIPKNRHSPITQQLVIIKSSKKQQLAKDFVSFILSEKGQEIINNSGYR